MVTSVYKYMFLWLAFFVGSMPLYMQAQEKTIRGKVIDSQTKEPLAFCNIYYKQSLLGTVSDLDGEFSIEYTGASDTLIISAVGYTLQKYFTPQIRNRQITIKLDPVNIKIAEVKVRPRKSRSHYLLHKIHEFEPVNNTIYFKGIEGDEYSRTSIMFSKVDAKIKDKRVFKNTQGAFIMDSDSTCSVPVLMAENLSKFLIPADGSARITKKISEQKNCLDLFEGADMADITDEMTINLNYYRPFISLLGKNFASPLAKNALFYYKMWVSDSLIDKEHKYIQVTFKPKRPKDLAFEGYFWVEDSTYAVTEIKVTLSPEANINYIRDIRTHNIYEKCLDGKWYYKSKYSELLIDYTPGSDTTQKVTTYISKVTSFQNLKRTSKNSFDDELLQAKEPTKLKAANGLSAENYWAQNRFVPLDAKEQQIYASIDTLKKNPFVQILDNSINMFLTGYWEAGLFDYGPYLDFYRHNKIEGHRGTFAMRTSEKFNPGFSVGGYLGYGSLDKKAKYGLNTLLAIDAEKYTLFGAEIWDDVRKIGDNENLSFVRENSYGSGEDNLISSLTAYRQNDKLSKKQYASLWFEHDLRKGITSRIKFIASRTYKGPYVDFMHNGISEPFVEQLAVSANLRFSFKENALNEYLRRVYLGNKYPVINFNVESGYSFTSFSKQPYLKIHTTIKHKLRLGMGYFKYLVEAGKVFGKVPFTMLEIHRGNETYGYARYNFNLLNYMEYASDMYVNFHSTYNFGGFFLNRIPLIRRLNLREIISFKGIVGNLANKHAKILDFPTGMSKVAEPYGELGVGLTNIGQYGRVEYVWRLSDNKKDGIMDQGLRFRFEVSF